MDATRFRETVQESIRVVRANLVEEGLWPPEGHGTIDADVTYEALEDIRRHLEREAAELLSSLSSAHWLRSIRDLSYAALSYPDEAPALTVARTRIAEVLSSLAPGRDEVPQVGAVPRSRSDDHNQHVLARLMSLAHVLHDAHVGMRLAGKKIGLARTNDFRIKPAWTPSQALAITRYDERASHGDEPFIGGAGLPMVKRNSDLAVVGPHDLLLVAPSLEPALSRRTLAKWGRSDLDVAFNVESMDLLPLLTARAQVVPGSGSPTYPKQTRALATLLRAVRLMLDEHLEAVFAPLLHDGYLEMTGLGALGHYVRATEDFQRAVFANDATLTAETLIEALADSSLNGSTWPVRPGPPFRMDRESVMFDIVACSHALNDALGFLPGLANTDALRGDLFERMVQDSIDNSPWGGIPEELRACRRRPLRDERGRNVTDLDAIGLRDGVLLLVDCKSHVKDVNRHLVGDRAALLSDAKSVEVKVSGRPNRPGTGWADKCARLVGRRGINFDFRQYTTGLCVVVTPVPVYVESEFIDRTHAYSMYELAEGLYAASSFAEFTRWLHADVDGTGHAIG